MSALAAPPRSRVVRKATIGGHEVLVKRCTRCEQEKVVDQDLARSEFTAICRNASGEIIGWATRCRQCIREVTAKGESLGERLRPGCQPASRFAEWLREASERYGGRRRLAGLVGIHEDQIRVLQRGWYMHAGKRYEVRGVTEALVDRVLTAEGSITLEELYPLDGAA